MLNISYAIIALVALPVLPDYSYKLKDIPVLPGILEGFNVDLGKFDTLDLINPRNIWFIVVLITGIDVFGYILSRIVGSKSGFAVTSFMAGFVSSASTTQSLALRSKKSTFINHLVAFITFILINATNLLSKSVYSYLQGDKRFALKFFVSVLVIIGASAIWLLFI